MVVHVATVKRIQWWRAKAQRSKPGLRRLHVFKFTIFNLFFKLSASTNNVNLYIPLLSPWMNHRDEIQGNTKSIPTSAADTSYPWEDSDWHKPYFSNLSHTWRIDQIGEEAKCVFSLLFKLSCYFWSNANGNILIMTNIKLEAIELSYWLVIRA